MNRNLTSEELKYEFDTEKQSRQLRDPTQPENIKD